MTQNQLSALAMGNTASTSGSDDNPSIRCHDQAINVPDSIEASQASHGQGKSQPIAGIASLTVEGSLEGDIATAGLQSVNRDASREVQKDVPQSAGPQVQAATEGDASCDVNITMVSPSPMQDACMPGNPQADASAQTELSASDNAQENSSGTLMPLGAGPSGAQDASLQGPSTSSPEETPCSTGDVGGVPAVTLQTSTPDIPATHFPQPPLETNAPSALDPLSVITPEDASGGASGETSSLTHPHMPESSLAASQQPCPPSAPAASSRDGGAASADGEPSFLTKRQVQDLVQVAVAQSVESSLKALMSTLNISGELIWAVCWVLLSGSCAHI